MNLPSPPFAAIFCISRKKKRRPKMQGGVAGGNIEGDPPGEPLCFPPSGPPAIYQASFLLHLYKLKIAVFAVFLLDNAITMD
jgi:hypothetical protein